MLTIEKFVTASPDQMEIVIEGMRNPMNSWNKMDSGMEYPANIFHIGERDLGLMKRLNNGGSVNYKYRRMIPVWVMINAPLYWWKEFDTYKVGTVGNSCSTMHKVMAKEFIPDDFSHDRIYSAESYDVLLKVINRLNNLRESYLNTTNTDIKVMVWNELIQLLPSDYNQKRLIFTNYEVLSKIYGERRNHKLGEWHTFCDWIVSLPNSEIITSDKETMAVL